jgi:putative spermidine/putrescine transport system permease protein
MKGRDDRLGTATVAVGRLAVWLSRAATLTLFLLPLAVIVLVALNPTGISPSLADGVTLRWFRNALEVQELRRGMISSLQIASIVVPVSLVIGTAGAYAVWRHRPLPMPIAETLLSLPILVPLVVTGLALLNAFSRSGMNVGFRNIVIAHVILTFPFVVRFVLNGLARYDERIDEAAQSLGASPTRAFWRVTFPLLRPALFAGGLFSFVVSFDDFGVAIFLTDAKTTTLPIAMYQYFQWNVDPTLAALSAMLVFVAFAIAVVCEKTIGLERFVGVQH